MIVTIYLPFCIIWAREKPDNSTKPSEQYTIGYPDTCAFPRTKFESKKKKKKRNGKRKREDGKFNVKFKNHKNKWQLNGEYMFFL